MVELHLAKVDVAGSNPVSRSNYLPGDLEIRIRVAFYLYTNRKAQT